MTMILRPYQEEAKQNINNKMVEGVNKQVAVLATGLGKTIIFGHVVSDRKPLGKALILAHREELLLQAQAKLKEIDPFLRANIEQGNSHAYEDDSDVIVASVPTLGRSNSERILKYDPLMFKTIVIDEAHHASSETYKNILRHFGVLKGGEGEDDWNKDCLLLGVTATPSRNDNRGIDTVFDETVFQYGIVEGIKNGYLVTIRAFRVNTTTDLTGVKKTAGDFNLGELGEAVNTDERNILIVKAYLERIPGKQAIVFAVDIAHTKALTEEFVRQGVAASFVTGEVPTEERRQRLADFANGKYQVMVNAMVLTEGYDNPSVEAILMARPTQSGILYQQMVGRGTRLFSGKQFLTVIDFVDNTRTKSLQTSGSLIGLGDAVDFKGNDIIRKKEEIDELLELAPNVDLSKLDVDRIQYAIEEVDLLAGLKVPDEIAQDTKYDWHRYVEGEYRVGLGNGNHIAIRETVTGQFEVSEHKLDTATLVATDKSIGSFETLQIALFEADRFIIRNYSESVKLISNTATWRSDKPTPAQLSLLKGKFRVNQLVIDQLSKGQASRLITKLIDHADHQRNKL